MELLNKIFGPFKEKARSPLYGAFIFAWIIWNWRIILTVLFPNQANLDPYSLTQYISIHYLNIYDSVIFPLLFSLFYIFIFPLIDIHVIKYSEAQKRKKIDEKIKIGRQHYVDGSLYFDLQLKFEEERKKINETDITNKELKGNILRQDNEITKLKGEIENWRNKHFTVSNELVSSSENSRELQDRISLFRNRKELKSKFEGRWTLTYQDTKNSSIKGVQEIEIINREYWVINGPNNRVLEYELMISDYDIEQKYFTFAKYSKNNQFHIISTVNIINPARLEGFENHTTAVIYVKS